MPDYQVSDESEEKTQVRTHRNREQTTGGQLACLLACSYTCCTTPWLSVTMTPAIYGKLASFESPCSSEVAKASQVCQLCLRSERHSTQSSSDKNHRWRTKGSRIELLQASGIPICGTNLPIPKSFQPQHLQQVRALCSPSKKRHLRTKHDRLRLRHIHLRLLADIR